MKRPLFLLYFLSCLLVFLEIMSSFFLPQIVVLCCTENAHLRWNFPFFVVFFFFSFACFFFWKLSSFFCHRLLLLIGNWLKMNKWTLAVCSSFVHFSRLSLLPNLSLFSHFWYFPSVFLSFLFSCYTLNRLSFPPLFYPPLLRLSFVDKCSMDLSIINWREVTADLTRFSLRAFFVTRKFPLIFARGDS